jgi:hypothetical protein
MEILYFLSTNFPRRRRFDAYNHSNRINDQSLISMKNYCKIISKSYIIHCYFQRNIVDSNHRTTKEVVIYGKESRDYRRGTYRT